MSTTTPRFNTEAIGQWSDPVQFAVTRERIQAYAAATNDPIPPHTAGDYAPPVFAIVPSFQTAGEAAVKVIPGELLLMILTVVLMTRLACGGSPCVSRSRSRPVRRSRRASGMRATALSPMRRRPTPAMS
jgi:hypothetical protein